jgi:hypothetical protein
MYLDKYECNYLAMVLEHIPHRSLVGKMVGNTVEKMDCE